MKTALIGSKRIDEAQDHPHGETKLINISQDVRKPATQQQFSEQDALHVELEQGAREFVQSGGEIYSRR